MSEPTKTPRKITLEELLRLKRHERPGPEFWLRFDRELNQRVWRSLVLPSQPDGILGGIFGRRLRWMAVGMISSAAFVFAIWPGATAPRLAAVAPGPAAVASQISRSAPGFFARRTGSRGHGRSGLAAGGHCGE